MNLISLINSLPFGEPAEKGYFLYTKMPRAAVRHMESENFKGTVRWAAEKSPFYKRKFAELGIDAKKVRTPEDLKDFYTTAEDIRQNPDDFVCQTADTAYESTGTTSKKTKRVYFSRQEVREAGWAGAVGLWGVGLRKTDRVASAFDYSFWVSGPVLVASCETLGCFHVEAGRMDPDEFYERLSDYRLSVLVGDPSWLVRFTQIAEKRGIWKTPLKLIIGGGENMTEEARRYVEGVWKCDYLMSYGQTEAFGAIGMESRAKEGYMLNEFHNYFEIVDKDKDGYGELVYTTVNRRVMPLIRYKSGDVTRFIEGPSKLGLPGRRIEKLKGRMNEWVATAMGNLAPWMFEPVLAPIAEISPDWQVVIEKSGHLDRITLTAESDGGEAVRQKILARFSVEMPDAWKNFQKGFFEIDARVVPKNSLRVGRKLLRIHDKRKF